MDLCLSLNLTLDQLDCLPFAQVALWEVYDREHGLPVNHDRIQRAVCAAAIAQHAAPKSKIKPADLLPYRKKAVVKSFEQLAAERTAWATQNNQHFKAPEPSAEV